MRPHGSDTLTCPDWVALADDRDDGSRGEALWLDALEHRESCAPCREASLVVDPTLMFLELPEIEVNEAEIVAMQERVNIARRFVEASPEPEPQVSRPFVRWAAVAAGLLFIALAAPMPWETAAEEGAVQASLNVERAVLQERSDLQTLPSDEALAQVLADHLESLPLVEGADVRYQVSGESVDLAVVLHAGLDL